MKVALIALNATYGHTNPAIRYLRNYYLQKSGKTDSVDIICREFSINDERLNILEDLKKLDAKVYAFSCYIWNINQILKICDNLKSLIPDSAIVLGGPEVSFDSVNILRENKSIDFIVKGPGEEAFRKLLNSIINGSIILDTHINGQEKSRIISADFTGFCNLKFPYNYEEIGDVNKQYYYESSRGCPFSCSYCLSSVDKHLYLLDEVKVIKDLEVFISKGVKQVKFVDRTFNADDKRAQNIWKHLIDLYNSKPYETNFHFEVFADLLSPDSLEILKSAPEGIFRFEIGIQSTDNSVLKNVNRKSNLEKLFKNIAILSQEGNIEIHLDLIAGLPGETLKLFKNSFNQVFLLNPGMLQLGFLKMLKGSQIREEAYKYEMAYSSFPPYEILSNKFISFDELMLIKRVEYVLEKFYNSKQFIYSLKYAINSFNKDSFSFFEAFADYFDDNKLFSRRLSRKELVNSCLRFCCTYMDKDELEIFSDLLKYDYYRFDKKGSIEGISFNNSAFHPDYDKKREIKKYHDNSFKLKAKKYRMEKYCFDPLVLVKTGEVVRTEAFVIYDFTKDKPVIDEIIICNTEKAGGN